MNFYRKKQPSYIDFLQLLMWSKIFEPDLCLVYTLISLFQRCSNSFVIFMVVHERPTIVPGDLIERCHTLIHEVDVQGDV